MVQSIQQFLLHHGFYEIWARILANFAAVVLILLGSTFVYYVVKRILTRMVEVYGKFIKNKWGSALRNGKLIVLLSRLAAAVVIHVSAPAFPKQQGWIQRLVFCFILFTIIRILFTLLDEIERIYRSFSISREKPIKGFLQIVKIVLSILAAIIIVSALIERSPWALLSGIGVFSAVLMLIFQDSILGFVAGVQLSGNDMVHVGDWIEVPKYSAEGEVVDITLNTVKLKGGDKTVVMIPTRAMVTDSFRNWRGMVESGGRKIQSSIFIDMDSIEFCDEEMLDRFEKMDYLKEYICGIRQKQETEGENFRVSNVVVFREYVQAYLKHHPSLRGDMTRMVRQLAPSQYGLPVEIYCFADTTDWAICEEIQADIFDHVLAVLPQFGLRIFQSPSGSDMKTPQSDGSDTTESGRS